MAAALSEGKKAEKAEKAEKGPMATLEKLQKMVEKGLITQADYDKKKDQILAAMSRGWLPLAEVELLSDSMELKVLAILQICNLRSPSVPHTPYLFPSWLSVLMTAPLALQITSELPSVAPSFR